MENFTLGTSVFSSDGEKLGVVKEQSDGLFKLDVSGSPDYWLSTSDVLSSGMDRVTMQFRQGPDGAITSGTTGAKAHSSGVRSNRGKPAAGRCAMGRP